MTLFSIVVPVYNNEASIPRLLSALADLAPSFQELGLDLELVAVVDGSPDGSYRALQQQLSSLPFPSRLVGHSRNFGSFAAIRTGLAHGRGEYFGVMAADLQEPPELLVEFARSLTAGDAEVAVGSRTSRDDSWFGDRASRLFWGLYRRFVVPEMPAGGVDVFGCSRLFRDHLLALDESRSSLIGLIFWLGFERVEIPYERRTREEGESGWSLRGKLRYMSDSVFAFTDYPIRLLLRFGLLGSIASIIAAVVVIIARLSGSIEVPGYAALMLAVLTLGSLILFGLGLVGAYAWRAYENTKERPSAIVARIEEKQPELSGRQSEASA